MPIEDVAWGSEIYRNAVDHGIGTQLKNLGSFIQVVSFLCDWSD